MVDASLNDLFNDTVNFVTSTESEFKPNKALKLKMYSLYKQATEGDLNSKRPSILDVVGRAKHDAWKALKGTSCQEAMQEYIDQVQAVRVKFDN